MDLTLTSVHTVSVKSLLLLLIQIVACLVVKMSINFPKTHMYEKDLRSSSVLEDSDMIKLTIVTVTVQKVAQKEIQTAHVHVRTIQEYFLL